ncbi:MAG: PaaI family thioesterase [Desulfarculaceae bacterium]|jgi:uncharacterized protein (TIGR00369 family)
MKTINPDWIREIQKNVNSCPYFSLLSLTIEDISWGSARLEVDLEHKHIQPWGVVHGGVFAGLADAAAFWAVFSQVEPDVGLVTVEMKINFLAPAKNGRLVGRGRSLKVGRSLGLAETRVEDQDGLLVAHGVATMMKVPSWEMESQGELPPKYLAD